MLLWKCCSGDANPLGKLAITGSQHWVIEHVSIARLGWSIENVVVMFVLQSLVADCRDLSFTKTCNKRMRQIWQSLLFFVLPLIRSVFFIDLKTAPCVLSVRCNLFTEICKSLLRISTIYQPSCCWKEYRVYGLDAWRYCAIHLQKIILYTVLMLKRGMAQKSGRTEERGDGVVNVS